MEFWKEWQKAIIVSMQERAKWSKETRNLKVDDLEENLPPTVWKLVRIKEVYPGGDGLVRNVKLRTAGSKKLVSRR